jgi:hypothetical protein
VLRWDSYVNLRHVYKMDWSYLRPYINPDVPRVLDFRLEKESLIRLLSKSRFLTGYETGAQVWDSRINRQFDRHLQWSTPDQEHDRSGPLYRPSTMHSPVASDELLHLGPPEEHFIDESSDSEQPKDQRKGQPDWYELLYRYFEMILGWPRTILQRLKVWLSAS